MTFHYQHHKPEVAIETGSLDAMWTSILRRVGVYLGRYHHVKVGITNDYNVRWRQHKGDGWEKMKVIYKSPCRSDRTRLEDVRALETAIIDHFWYGTRSHIDCHNQVTGGGGPISTGEQYVYLLLSGKWRKRRRRDDE